MVGFIKYDLLDQSWILQYLLLGPCLSRWQCLMPQCCWLPSAPPPRGLLLLWQCCILAWGEMQSTTKPIMLDSTVLNIPTERLVVLNCTD